MIDSRRKAIAASSLFILAIPRLISGVLAADPVVVQTTCPSENMPLAVQEFKSPSGTYRLTIEAETQNKVIWPGKILAEDASKSRCRLYRGTTLAWDRRMPFVMSDVIVTDQGQTVGVAFKVNGAETKEWTQSLFLVMLDVTGDRLLCEKHLREQSKLLIGNPVTPQYPDPEQIAVAPDLDRVVFWLREATADRNRFEDVVFRVYELSTGDRKAIVYQDNINPQPKAHRFLDDVRPVAMPELLMLHYVHYRRDTKRWPPEYYSESLELVDVGGLVVWQKSIDNPKIEEDRSIRMMDMAKPQYLNCSRVASTKSGFVIENGASGKSEEYRVSKGKSGWAVSDAKPAGRDRKSPSNK